MVKRYYGGIMSANLISTSSTVASGFFGTHSQMQAKESGRWPVISVTTAPAPGTGALYLWGTNGRGQLGNNTTTATSSPIQTVAGGTNWKSVGVAEFETGAIKNDGTLWAWGNNNYGQLGVNDVAHRSSPVQTIAGGTNWANVSVGSRFNSAGTLAAIKTDGTLWTWGYNYFGTLGTNDVINRSSPVQTVSGGTNWKQVSLGEVHCAAIKTDNTLWLWGRGDGGERGDGTVTQRMSSPVQTVSGGTNWATVSAGYAWTAAIKTDGTLWTWGSNYRAKLGDNTNIAKSSPVQTAAAGSNWSKVSAGYSHGAAIKTDGTLWIWGHNSYGQLGDSTSGTGTHKSSPVQTITGGSNWKQISCGNGFTAAIKTDNTLWMWGKNYFGQLGDNTRIHRSSPVQTWAGGTDWVSLGNGVSQFFAAIKSS